MKDQDKFEVAIARSEAGRAARARQHDGRRLSVVADAVSQVLHTDRASDSRQAALSDGSLSTQRRPRRESNDPRRCSGSTPIRCCGEVSQSIAARESTRAERTDGSACTPTPGARSAQALCRACGFWKLTKIWAGPYTGKLLAFLGAEVIRVESYDSLDATRAFGNKDINDAPGFQAINPGKYSVQLSMKSR